MKTKYRVKVWLDKRKRWGPRWRWECQVCASRGGWWSTPHLAHDDATSHAATCTDLHWRNWEAACPSCCKLYGGVIAPACPKCQGYGWIKGEA